MTSSVQVFPADVSIEPMPIETTCIEVVEPVSAEVELVGVDSAQIEEGKTRPNVPSLTRCRPNHTRNSRTIKHSERVCPLNRKNVVIQKTGHQRPVCKYDILPSPVESIAMRFAAFFFTTDPRICWYRHENNIGDEAYLSDRIVG